MGNPNPHLFNLFSEPISIIRHGAKSAQKATKKKGYPKKTRWHPIHEAPKKHSETKGDARGYSGEKTDLRQQMGWEIKLRAKEVEDFGKKI